MNACAGLPGKRPAPWKVLAVTIILVLAVLFVAMAFEAIIDLLPSVERTFYALPSGNGSECSYESPCSLTQARDKVRSVNGSMSGDILVYLRGGTYTLSSPLELTSQDSGSGGHSVIYSAYEEEKPVLSGGEQVSGWSLYDTRNVYRAYVGTSLQTRQLYVNDVLAIRARSETDPSGFAKTTSGYTTTDTTMQDWHNVGDIEFVDFAEWVSYRCGVSSISGPTITMKQPCWDNTQGVHKPEEWTMGPPKWVENAYELLDEPGEWYLDRSSGYLYYKPRPEENMTTATVVAPKLEKLVEGTGTLDEPIHDVKFNGLTFMYATWLAPSTDDGYAAVQAGFRFVGSDIPHAQEDQEKPLAHVSFSAAESIRFERNIFTHLGAVGLAFEHGSQNNAIIGNRFHDISGGGVYLGNVDDHHPDDSRAVVKNNVVKNNDIARIGAEYFDQVGIWVGYTDGSVIEHNELYDLPYGGISVGWGWGCQDPDGEPLGDCSRDNNYTTPTVARNNKIRHNLMHDYMKILEDGGGIYTLGAQPNSEISYNYIYNQKNKHAPLYLDEGTQYYLVKNNVVASAPEWLYIWTHSIMNNSVRYNYSDTHNFTNKGTNNRVSENTVANDRDWPKEAQSIIIDAGLEAEYRDKS
jgi:hypothetical protein